MQNEVKIEIFILISSVVSLLHFKDFYKLELGHSLFACIGKISQQAGIMSECLWSVYLHRRLSLDREQFSYSSELHDRHLFIENLTFEMKKRVKILWLVSFFFSIIIHLWILCSLSFHVVSQTRNWRGYFCLAWAPSSQHYVSGGCLWSLLMMPSICIIKM